MRTKTNLKRSLVMMILLVGLGGAAWADVVVDDFDSYPDHPDLRAVWNDTWTGGYRVEVFVEKGALDANLVRDGNSMKYDYDNDVGGGGTKNRYSEAWANTADLEVGSDWTTGGVEALVLYFYGDPCNAADPVKDRMWVVLSDDTNEGMVKYAGDMNDIKKEQWQEWNIDLQDPCLSAVDNNNVTKVYIGFGVRAGTGPGQDGGLGTVYFDDIWLRTPFIYIYVVYVDSNATGANNGTSWADAYKYLQDALSVAQDGNDIWVAEGTYYPDANTANGGGSGDRYATFQLISGVGIYGGFPSGGGTRDPNTYETILSGDLNGDDIGFTNNSENSYHVVTGSGTEPNAVIDGFTITAGNADSSWPNNAGGGMFNSYGNATVANCTFSGNSADYGGGMFNSSGSPTVSNCRFIANSASWTGGGMYNDIISNPKLTNCTFSGNSTTNYGGGMNNAASSPTVTNCTFSGNSAVNNGGGMSNYSNSSPMVTNCILWGNTASSGAQIYDDGTSSTTVSYSDVEGGWAGATNIAEDPLFKDADGDDDIVGTEDDNLQVSSFSPCIDAGDNNSVPADITDLDEDGDKSERTPLDLAGNDRFTDDPVIDDTGNPTPGYPEIVEMGAYERYEFCGDAGYPYPAMDFSHDCVVNFVDFAMFLEHWLEEAGPE